MSTYDSVLSKLIEQVPWVFSGIGVAFLSAVFGVTIWGVRRYRARKITPRQPEVDGVRERLVKSVSLLNESAIHEKVTISKIAEILDCDSIGDVERYFSGRAEPPIAFIRKYCSYFYLQDRWLLHGDLAPFSHPSTYELMAESYLGLISESNAYEVYFIRSSSEIGETMIALKYDEWRYQLLDGMWHVSGHVGGTGAAQLLSLCELLCSLLSTRDPPYVCGQVLESKKFERLMNGWMFPGAALQRLNQHRDWVYALPDVFHRLSSAPNYYSWYGQGFLDAQEIVRNQITPDHPLHQYRL